MKAASARPTASVVEAAAGGWLALGDEDDHFRLAALIAADLKEVGAPAGLADRCLDPQAPWPDRREALLELLHSPQAAGRSVSDIDALHQEFRSLQEQWDDRRFLRPRRELLSDLITAGVRQGWAFLRPSPLPQVSEELAEAGVQCLDLRAPVPFLSSISPELWGVTRALIDRDVTTEKELRDFAAYAAADEGAEGATDHHVISLAAARVSMGARDTALRLSLLRESQQYNGSLGVLPLEGSSSHRVDRAAVTELVEWGLVQHDNGVVQLPRAVRVFFRAIAETTGDIPDPRGEHAWIARQLAAQPKTIRGRVEGHYHSLKAHDIEGAFGPDAPYVGDVRALGVWLSRKGVINEMNYLRAADVFDRLRTADPKDSYAWEYWAFNKALGTRNAWVRMAPPLRDELETAYRTAWELEKDRAGDLANPLYHGRWFGFRAECGEATLGEFVEAVRAYDAGGGSRARRDAAVAWFAGAALGGADRSLERRTREVLLPELLAAYGEDRLAEWRAAGRRGE